MAGAADAAATARCDDCEVAKSLSELAFDLAQRALDHQESTLEDLRSRAGTLLTATALVATFLGARALDGAANATCSRRARASTSRSRSQALTHFVANDATLEDAYVVLADWLHGKDDVRVLQ